MVDKLDLYDLRRREVQALGAALSCRNWHMMETAYNSLRDKLDRAGFTVAGPRPDAATPANGEQVERVKKGWFAVLRAGYVAAEAAGENDGPPARYGGIEALRAALAASKTTTPTEDARERVKVLEEALRGFVDDLTDKGRNPRTCLSINHDGLKARIDAAHTALGNKETDRHG